MVSNDLKAVGMIFGGSANLSFYNTERNILREFGRMIRIDIYVICLLR